MSQYMIIKPTKDIHGGECNIPSSKPETQRALIVASLASGLSHIHNPLKCLETDTMIKALQNIGSSVIESNSYWEVQGNGNNIIYKNKTIQCLGSGLVFRTLSALSCFSKTPVVITGDS